MPPTTREQMLINYDQYNSVTQVAMVNIDLQIDNLKRATGGLQLAMYDTLMQLVHSPGWKSSQRKQWIEDVNAAMTTPEEDAIFRRLASEVYATAEPFLSGATVTSHSQPSGPDQACIHTLGQHMGGEGL